MTDSSSYMVRSEEPPLTSQWIPEQLAQLPHDNAALRLLVSVWVLNLLALVFLLTRVYCKYLRHRGLWWDDGVLIAAYVRPPRTLPERGKQRSPAPSLTTVQLCSTIETTLLSYSTKLGYGLHIWDIPTDLLPRIPDLLRVIDLAGTFSLTAAIWSKTSFALSMLRLTQGWLKALVWFIIVSMNIAMGLSALFVWVQCTPIEKSWNPFVDGMCWPPYVLVYYNIFSAGNVTAYADVFASRSMLIFFCPSLLRHHGHVPRATAVEAHLGAADEETGEDRRSVCHELRCLVCPALKLSCHPLIGQAVADGSTTLQCGHHCDYQDSEDSDYACRRPV